MWSRHSVKLHLFSILAALLVIVPALAVEAQQKIPVEATQLQTWFEVPARGGQSLEDALAPMVRSGDVGGNNEDGFLAPLPYNADQLTENAVNFGTGGTLKVWAELFCRERGDLETDARLRGVLRYQVWVQDSDGNMSRLAKFRARATDGDVFGESGVKLVKLRKGDTLWFQIIRDRVSPLRDVYCFFGYGIYREFLGE